MLGLAPHLLQGPRVSMVSTGRTQLPFLNAFAAASRATPQSRIPYEALRWARRHKTPTAAIRPRKALFTNPTKSTT